jgi:UDP-2,4-diacetamido-2,4,6-trideoxy-beta-L-altropyranose hydrolase
VLLFFGGADPHGLTRRAINAFGQLKKKPMVGVVVGLAHRDKEAIEADCQRHGFMLHVQTDRMASLLDAADLVIGGGGTTTWERCKLGVPSITVIVADNQREATEAVAARGATINLGDATEFSEERLIDAFEELVANPEKVRHMSAQALALVGSDGAGALRIADVMEALS